MDAASSSAPVAAHAESWLSRHVPPEVDLTPFTPAELYELFRGGEVEADRCERVLAWAARARGGIDVSIAEGLHALRKGDRLAELGFHLADYAREVLDLGKRAAEGLARLGAELQSRPLLREALRSGRVGLRAAQTVLPVAKGDQEALWVERAARRTVRELEVSVRRIRSGLGETDEEEEWLRLRAAISPDERALLDLGLEAADRVLGGGTRSEQLEALAQEYLGEFSQDGDGDEARPLGVLFGPAARTGEARRAALEEELERWSSLPPPPEWPAPDAAFDEATSAQEIDHRLRALAALRAGWEDLIGYCADAIRRSGMHLLLGFATFRHYVEERLGLPPRAVEQRAAFEEKASRSPALQEARQQGLSYERLRVLALLPEGELRSWIPRAKALTCVALRRAVEGERERQMRARRTLAVPVPRRVAVLLTAALETLRERARRPVLTGTGLAILSIHFVEHWKESLDRSPTRSQQVRERDLGQCQVPGCSHRATHAHHVQYRSRGGGNQPENLVALCELCRSRHKPHYAESGIMPRASVESLPAWRCGLRDAA